MSFDSTKLFNEYLIGIYRKELDLPENQKKELLMAWNSAIASFSKALLDAALDDTGKVEFVEMMEFTQAKIQGEMLQFVDHMTTDEARFKMSRQEAAVINIMADILRHKQ